MSGTAESEVRAVARAWDQAMVANDADAIGSYMADDWIITGPDGRTSGKAEFLALVRSGRLTHDVMTSDELSVRLYGDAAVVLARGVSGGRFDGHPFRETERSSNVFVRHDGVWTCVMTHLSRLAPDAP